MIRKTILLSLVIYVFSAPFAYSQDKLTAEEKAELAFISQDFDAVKESGKMNQAFNKRLSILGHLNVLSSDLTSYSALELNLAYKVSEYWLSVLISQSKAKFGTVAGNHTPNGSDNPDAEENNIRNQELQENFMTFGVGFGYEYSFLPDVLKHSKVRETIGCDLVYHVFAEELVSKNYSGFGIRPNYSLRYPIGSDAYLGVSLNYNLASVRRGESTPGEPGDERTLLLRWMDVAVSWSYYL